MLYLLAQWLEFEGLFNLVRYQTFRSGATLLTALVIGLIIGPKFISMLRVRQGKGQPIREDGPQTHLAKVGTPTMGGLMILTGLIISTLLWADLGNAYVWLVLFVTLGFGAIDVKTHDVESPGLVADRVRRALDVIPADRLVINPDCGLVHLPRAFAPCHRTLRQADVLGDPGQPVAGRPVRAAGCPVGGNPRRHLGIARMGCGDIGLIARKSCRQPFGGSNDPGR